MSLTQKRYVKVLLRTLVSGAILAYLFSQVSWRSVWQVVQTADTGLIALYFSAVLAGTMVSAVKWRVLCRALEISAGVWHLFLLYMVGNFFNNLLPTNVGGDVVRSYELGKTHGSHARALASVFMERFTGLVVLMVLALTAWLFDARLLSDWRIVALTAALAPAFVAGTWLVFSPKLTIAVQQRIRLKIADKALGKVRKFQEALGTYRHHRNALLGSLVLSVVFYANAILINYIGCRAFGVPVSWWAMCAAVPVILALSMIPISLGGIGLQEWAFTVVFGLVGVPPAVGLSVGLLFRARAIVFGLIGGALYPFVCGDAVPVNAQTSPVE